MAFFAVKAKLEVGDIILERRNWYISNIGLPGFWPHTALFVGTQSQILKALGDVPEVKRAYGDLNAHFTVRACQPWRELGRSSARSRTGAVPTTSISISRPMTKSFARSWS